MDVRTNRLRRSHTIVTMKHNTKPPTPEESHNFKVTFERTLFIVATLTAITGLFLDSQVIKLLLLLSGLIYLFGGWTLLNPSGKKPFFYPGLFGFVFNSAFGALIFLYNKSLDLDEFGYGAILFLVLASFFLIREKPKNFNQPKQGLIIRSAILIILSVLYLIF